MPMTYREPLPEGCPPDDAEEITTPRIVYRLVRSNPPTDDDFRSSGPKTRTGFFAESPSAKPAGCRFGRTWTRP